MHGRWRRRLSDALRGAPEEASAEALWELCRSGPPERRVRALLQLGARRDPSLKGLDPSCLQDPVPGVRRAAAWALGRLRLEEWASVLGERVLLESQPEVRFDLSVAAVSAGLDEALARGALAGSARQIVPTFYGPRDLSQVLGDAVAPMLRRFDLAVRGLDTERARQDALLELHTDPSHALSLELLALQRRPEDLELLLRALGQPGRRGRHAAVEALGLHGDPRCVSELLGVLRATDVDPGHGFQQRRHAALALGRLGLPSLGRPLVQAIEAEALDHEGRPGAGLGIQFPVRSALLLALGWSGDVSQAGVLVEHLANTHGSALGGFYLPAMAGLIALGPVAGIERALRGEQVGVANAIGVLHGWGHHHLVEPFVDDSRPRVAQAARLALELRSAESPSTGSLDHRLGQLVESNALDGWGDSR